MSEVDTFKENLLKQMRCVNKSRKCPHITRRLSLNHNSSFDSIVVLLINGADSSQFGATSQALTHWQIKSVSAKWSVPADPRCNDSLACVSLKTGAGPLDHCQ